MGCRCQGRRNGEDVLGHDALILQARLCRSPGSWRMQVFNPPDQAFMSTKLFLIKNVTDKRKGRPRRTALSQSCRRAYSIDSATKRTSPWAFATRSRADLRP